MRNLPTPVLFPFVIATLLAAHVGPVQARGHHARAQADARAADSGPVPVYVPKSRFGKIMAVMITTLVETHHQQAQLQPAAADGSEAAVDAPAQGLALEAATPGG